MIIVSKPSGPFTCYYKIINVESREYLHCSYSGLDIVLGPYVCEFI